MGVSAWERNGERRGQIASSTQGRLRGHPLGLGRLAQWAGVNNEGDDREQTQSSPGREKRAYEHGMQMHV